MADTTALTVAEQRSGPTPVETPAESRIRAERKRLGLTQARFAVLLGVSAGWCALIEKEPTFLSRRLAARAAKVLGCTAEELLPGGQP